MTTPTRDEQLVRDFLRPLGTVEPVRRKAPVHRPRPDRSGASRYLGYAAIALAAVLLVGAIALISHPGKSQKPAHRPVDRGVFRKTHGWITVSGKSLIAINPADPTQTRVLSRSMTIPIAWSRDGSQLLARGSRGPVVFHADGSRTRIPGTRVGGISFTPDGRRVILVDENGVLLSIPARGGKQRRIAGGGRPPYTGGPVSLVDYFDNQLSPDGGTLAYVVFRLHRPGPIRLIGSDGSDSRQLVSYPQVVALMGPEWQNSHNALIFPVSWLGDGSGIVLMARNSSGSQCALFAVNTDGSNLRRWGPRGPCPTGAALSPDGRQLAFSSANGNVVITDNAGQVNRTFHVPGQDHLFIAWQP